MEQESITTFLNIPNDSEFSLENIPFGCFSKKDSKKRILATRIGDYAVDLSIIEKQGGFDGPLFKQLNRQIFQQEYLNSFMSLSRPYWKQARQSIQKYFSTGSKLSQSQQLQNKILNKISDVNLHVPVQIGDYTDFYSSRSHAFNVGSIIRGPANALNQNWLHIPIGYHGRASSIVVDGTSLIRPRGQTKGKDVQQPSFTQCKRLDFEMEVGAFIGGTTNELGHPIKVNQAWNNIFGFVLLNDWSFRDFQTWQYVPLGPFTAKNGISTISPWIVTLQALEGCQVPLSKQQPQPLKYLQQKNHISYNINLGVWIKTNKMEKPEQIVKTNFKYMYWSCAQQLAHHSVTGCNMRPGDMLGSGTISGQGKEEFGSLLELTWGGQNKISLSNSQTRTFIEDGDTIIMTGYSQKNGKRIGFGQASGTVYPVLAQQEYY